MKTLSRVGSLVLIGAFVLTNASAVWAQKKTLAVSDIEATPALEENVKKKGKNNEMQRVLQSLDPQMIERFNATRKFDLVPRSDLKKFVKEGALSGNAGLPSADYFLVTTIDDFEDSSINAPLGETGQVASTRQIRFSATGKIYDSKTGKLLEAVSFRVMQNARSLALVNPNATGEGKLGDDLLASAAREMAHKIANRVTDVIFPVKVVSKLDKQITINCGDGRDIEKDQVWSIYAVGKEIIDPDTKEVLGREESKIGEAKIASVQPKVSTAIILGDDLGVAEGVILKRPEPASNQN